MSSQELLGADAGTSFGNTAMKVVMRADASLTHGSGHVMRCLTLARQLALRGHTAVFVAAIEGVEWLSAEVARFGFEVLPTPAHMLNARAVNDLQPDWVVLDSYFISPEEAHQLRGVRLLAIVDGDDRGIKADVILDGNLTVAQRPPSSSDGALRLTGPEFALVRPEWAPIRATTSRKEVGDTLRILAVMGSTDPRGAMLHVARSLCRIGGAQVIIVSPRQWRSEVEDLARAFPHITVVETSPALPSMVAFSDIVLSAAGTSAWDICTAGKPSVLVAIAENQRDSLNAAVGAGVAWGVDAISDLQLLEADVFEKLSTLIADPLARDRLSANALQVFDGEGPRRVVEVMERIA